MRTTQRRPEPGVIQRLLDAPHRFEFFQAVSLLSLCLRQNGVSNEETLRSCLRFQNSLSLGFPASQIEALIAETPSQERINSAEALRAAVLDRRLGGINLTPAFMGLLGANGALPYHITSRVADCRGASEGPRAFLDILSNRLVALFYQAWCRYRPEHMVTADGGDGFLPILLALSGATPRSKINGVANDGIADEIPAYFAAILGRGQVSAATMEVLLCDYFEVPIKIIQFVGIWDKFDQEELTLLGKQNCVLGRGAMLGSREWRNDLRVRIRIGPLNKDRFEEFLPGAAAARALKKMTELFNAPTISYDVQLVLQREDVQMAKLAAGAKFGVRLGYDAFLLSKPSDIDREAILYPLARADQRAPNCRSPG